MKYIKFRAVEGNGSMFAEQAIALFTRFLQLFLSCKERLKIP